MRYTACKRYISMLSRKFVSALEKDAIDYDAIIIKKVTYDDYSDVLSLRKPDDVYGGYDYLPACYKYLITRPSNEGYAAVLNGPFVRILFCT